MSDLDGMIHVAGVMWASHIQQLKANITRSKSAPRLSNFKPVMFLELSLLCCWPVGGSGKEAFSVLQWTDSYTSQNVHCIAMSYTFSVNVDLPSETLRYCWHNLRCLSHTLAFANYCQFPLSLYGNKFANNELTTPLVGKLSPANVMLHPSGNP